jgi:hypothetical protein
MSTTSQNIFGTLGLDKVKKLRAAAANSQLKKAPALDPDYPWFVVPFNPKFFGLPAPLDSGDGQS